MSSTFRFVDPSDHQARPPPLLSDNTDNRRGCSKAQACLHKILHIIASSKNPSSSLPGSNRGLGIDLNLRLCSASFGDEEEEEEEREEENVGFVDESGSFSSSSVAAPEVGKRNTVLEKSSEVERETAKQTDETNCEQVVVAGERDHDKAEEEEEEEENGDDDSASEITNVQVQSFEKSDEGRASEMKRSNSDGFLGLLVEAAKLVSGRDVGDGDADEDEDEDDETESRERSSQRRELHDSPRTKVDASEESTKTELLGPKKKRQVSEAAFGESEGDAPPPPPPSPPVVRTKRGRNQVLPYRFRDSVLEPWARLSRSNPVPSKRRVGVKP